MASPAEGGPEYSSEAAKECGDLGDLDDVGLRAGVGGVQSSVSPGDTSKDILKSVALGINRVSKLSTLEGLRRAWLRL